MVDLRIACEKAGICQAEDDNPEQKSVAQSVNNGTLCLRTMFFLVFGKLPAKAGGWSYKLTTKPDQSGHLTLPCLTIMPFPRKLDS